MNSVIKNILDELSDSNNLLDEAVATGAVGGFVGRKGQGVDDLFAGGFKPDEGELKDLFKQQIKHKENKTKWNQEFTPELERDFVAIEDTIDPDTEDEENISDDIRKRLTWKNTTNKMKFVDLDIDYDDEGFKNKRPKPKFDDENDWKYIYKTKKHTEEQEEN